MKRVLIILAIAFIVTSCAYFGATNNDSQIPTISAPPQKLNESDQAMPIVLSNKLGDEAAEAKAAQQAVQQENTPRIQENRENGVVDQIKVNNKNLPSYYIYPTQQQNYNYNNIPDQNINTSNWQINW
jgi:hypothetical protein